MPTPGAWHRSLSRCRRCSLRIRLDQFERVDEGHQLGLDPSGSVVEKGQAPGLAPPARDRSGHLHPKRHRRLVRDEAYYPSSLPLLLELGHPHPQQSCARTAPDRVAAPRGIPEHQRLDLLGSFLADDGVHLVDRPAGCLVLLYALPITRTNRLRATDFESVDGGHALRIGADLVPVPTALALVGSLAERPSHISTARYPDRDWLFPGGRAGQPIEPDQLAERLN